MSLYFPTEKPEQKPVRTEDITSGLKCCRARVNNDDNYTNCCVTKRNSHARWCEYYVHIITADHCTNHNFHTSLDTNTACDDVPGDQMFAAASLFVASRSVREELKWLHEMRYWDIFIAFIYGNCFRTFQRMTHDKLDGWHSDQSILAQRQTLYNIHHTTSSKWLMRQLIWYLGTHNLHAAYRTTSSHQPSLCCCIINMLFA